MSLRGLKSTTTPVHIDSTRNQRVYRAIRAPGVSPAVVVTAYAENSKISPSLFQQQQQQRHVTTKSAYTDAAAALHQPTEHPAMQPTAAGTSTSKCPFLASLPTPPPSQSHWYNRLQQLLQPLQYQQAALGPHTVAFEPGLPGLASHVIVGSGKAVKKLLSSEAEGSARALLIEQQEDGSVVDLPLHHPKKHLQANQVLLGPNSVLMSSEPRHSYLRRLIMQAFTSEAVAALVPRMQAVLTKYLESWADAGSEVIATDEIHNMTFEFIIAVAFGHDFPDDTISMVARWCDDNWKGLVGWPFINLPWTTYGKALAANAKVQGWLRERVEESKEQLARGESLQPCILTSLIQAVDEDGCSLTEREICDNMLLFLLAGYHTSSVSLTKILSELQNHPAAWERMREEQEQLLAQHGNQISWAQLKQMPYTEAVIREALRLHNTVPAVYREAGKDFELDGYRIDAGTTLYIPLTHVVTNDPRWLEDEPTAFKPERMLTPEGKKQGDQIAFGFGNRVCAGYAVAMSEMKVFLALLARGYDFSVDNNTEWRQQVGEVPVNGLPMTVSRRAHY